MKENIVKYKIESSTKKTIDTLLNNTDNYNLSFEYSDEEGIDIHKNVSPFSFSPNNFGPIIKINLVCFNFSNNDNECSLVLKTFKGNTYKVHFWTSIIFMILTFLISVCIITYKDFYENIYSLIIPFIFLIYLLFIEIIVETTESKIINRLEEILIHNNIKYQKL